MGPDLWEMFEDGAANDEVAAILRLGHASTLPKGVRLVSQFGEIVTIRTTRSNILNVSAAPEVADISAGDTYLGPDVEAAEATEYAEVSSDTLLDTDVRRPADEKATGRGVVVGLVDWGFDFAHPDFLKPDGTSRILAIWDQRGSKLANSPQPFGYGVVHDQNAINAALTQPDPYAALGYHPADADTGIGSHGTHVLSIAAGGGGENRPVGVAPEADLVVVHNAPWDEIDTGRLGDSVTLLEGIDFIARLAGDRPWVINLSMGKHGEQHDGSTLIEQGLDAAIRSSAGRAVCLSAGNYFDKRIHASGQLRPTQERTLIWEIQENKPTNNQLEFWYSWQDKFEVRVKSPDGAINARAGIGERAKFLVGGKEVGNVYHRGQEPNNLDNHIVVYLYKDAPTGEWEITLVGEDVIDGRYHAWIERDVSCSRCQSRLREVDADPHCTTGTICNGRRTLAVGAYNKHDPEMRLAHFSSVGPTRDGRLKPDLCAPGVAILAARSAPREKHDPPQLCTRLSGTSMAAPCVTGTIALMFQAAQRRLRIEETHNILLQSARKVSVPEDIPERIGIGFLDIEEAVEAARKLPPLVSSFKQTTVHSTPGEKPRNQNRESVDETREAVPSEGLSPGAAFAVALSLTPSSGGGSPDSEAIEVSEVAPFSFDENYRATVPQTTRSAGAEWAELADDIVADMGDAQPVKILHEMFERSDDLSDLATDVAGNPPSAAQIFDAIVYSGNPKLRQQLTENFQVVALPKESAEGKVRAGDIIVRRTDGPGGHVSIVAAPGLKDSASLVAAGLVAESNSPGQYVQVIEGGGEFAHESEDKYARQLTDSFGRVLNDIVLLRLATPTQSVVTVNQAPAAPASKDPDAGESEAQSEIFNDNDLRYDMTEVPPVQTHHQVVVNGSTLKYTATAGRLPIKSGDGQTRAQMFYVAYTLDGQEAAKRPLTFLFNGGPGSASLWLHMGAMGPRKVALQPEGFLPPAPYHFEANPNTLLDKSDLVFIDAIGTGFSRAADSRSFGYFWGVRGDIEAFSEFIRLFITRNERWGSPLFLLGESYGTLRAAGIAGYLSEKGISFSGITLLSTVLNYQTLEATKTNDQPYTFLIPTYAMIAGYHHKLPADLAGDMDRARREAEQWASTDYANALAKGDSLSAAERQQIIDRMARYTGVGKDVIDEANLRIDVRKFTHYLLLDKKLRVGRFDGRFTGTDPQGLLDTQYYDPTEAATHPPFTSVFNNYVRSELGYKTDMPYYTRAQDADADSWNWGSAIDGFPDTATALRAAIVRNPYLKVLVMEGLYDLATPYSAANYTVDHLDLPGRYRDNISVATYEAGHMVYLPEAGLKKMKADEADFVARSVAPQKRMATELSEDADAAENDDASLLLTLNGVSLKAIGDGSLGQVPDDTRAAILAVGETDANALANLAFWQKHPELAGKKLDSKDPAQASLRREWSNLYFRGIRPLIWLRAMIDELDKYRGSIPREFLLGWIAWESDGDLKSYTSLGELGYFQIMWKSGEAKEQLHMTAEEFPKLSTDPDFSVAQGVALAHAYRNYISKNYPDIAEYSDLQLRLTKGRHAASGILRNALRKVQKDSTPLTWASVCKAMPSWMADNIGHTMNYAAKLKQLADLVPVVTKIGHESIIEQIAEDASKTDRTRISPTTAAPWRWMCNVYVCDFKYLCDSPQEATSRGSGVLISNRHVLTAAHVVWDAVQSGHMTVRVWPGRDGEDEPFGSSIGKARICPKYKPSNDDSEEWDYALITLEKPIGSTPAKSLGNASLGFWGSPDSSLHTAISPSDPATLLRSQGITAGYPVNVDLGKQLLCAKGLLHSVSSKTFPNLMFTRAMTTEGQSGSPFWIERNGELTLVGISIEKGESSNRVLRVTPEMLDQIAAWFSADGEKPWFPNRTATQSPHAEAAESQPFRASRAFATQILDLAESAGPPAATVQKFTDVEFWDCSEWAKIQLSVDGMESSLDWTEHISTDSSSIPPTTQAKITALDWFKKKGSAANAPYEVRWKGRIYYPRGAASGTLAGRRPFPVAILLHGNNGTWDYAAGKEIDNHLGYEYLQKSLAQDGIVSVSISTNLANLIRSQIKMRADYILAGLEILKRLNSGLGASGRFLNRLDLQNIGLMGHSRGGDAVVQAAIRNFGSKSFTIRAVCSLAPTDFTGMSNKKLVLLAAYGIRYLVLYGSHDGDVGGQDDGTTGTGFRHYDRAICERTMAFVKGAKHDRFNTSWDHNPPVYSDPEDCAPTDPAYLSPPDHQQLAIDYIGGLFRLELNRDASVKGLFDGSAAPSGAHDIALQWSSPYKPRTIATVLHGTPLDSTDKWTKGWTTLFPFNLPGTDQVYELGYKMESGEVAIDRVNPQTGTDRLWSDTWRKGWTHIIPFKIPADDRVYDLGYRSDTGEAGIDRIAHDGKNVETEIWKGTRPKQWSSVVPIRLPNDAEPYYLGYNKDTGEFSLDHIKAIGQGIETIFPGKRDKGSTMLMPFQRASDGNACILAYNKNSGAVSIECFAADGKSITTAFTAKWGAGWTSFASFALPGDDRTYYLACKEGDGSIAVDRIARDASGYEPFLEDRWTSGWSHLYCFDVKGKPHFLAYKRTRGDVAIGRLLPDHMLEVENFEDRPGGVSFDPATDLLNASASQSGMTRENFTVGFLSALPLAVPHQTFVLQARAKGAKYLAEVPKESRVWSGFDLLTFRLTSDFDLTSEATIAAGSLPDFKVRVVYGKLGVAPPQVAEVNQTAADIAGVRKRQRPFFRQIGPGGCVNATKLAFQTVAIPLSKFGAVNWNDVRAVEFEAIPASGLSVYFDSLAIMQS